jgi:hypothetical protein
MDVQEIEITIGKDGKVELKVRGVKGMECLVLTQDLEKALGGEILLRQMNPEAEETTPGNVDESTNMKSST